MNGSRSARQAPYLAFALAALLLTTLPRPAAAAEGPRHTRLAGASAIGGSHLRTVGFGAGYNRVCGSTRVREIQRRLQVLGYRLGPVDGLFGPRTRSAVRLLQYTLGVRPNGIVTPGTLALLRERSSLPPVQMSTGYASECGSARVRTVQRRLRTLGYRPGKVDGRFGPRTRDAVIRFQRDHDLDADGSIAPAAILASLRPDSDPARSDARGNQQPASPPASKRVASVPAGTRAQATGDGNMLPATLTGAALVLLAINALLILLAQRRPATEPLQQPAAIPAAPPTQPHSGGGEHSSDRRTDAAGRALAPGTRVYGYVSVAQRERHVDTDAYEAQAEKIRAFCDACELRLVQIVREAEPDHGRAGSRPGLRYLLEELAGGAASGLVVTELRRLSGASADLAPLLRWFEECDAALVALDVGLDTSTADGDRTARALAAVGDWEHERLSERSRRGLEEARAQGRTGHRPAVNDLPELRDRIQTLRAQGMTLQAIADVLNREGVPTLRGGAKWRPSSVQTAVGYRRPIGGTRPAGLPPSHRFAKSVKEESET